MKYFSFLILLTLILSCNNSPKLQDITINKPNEISDDDKIGIIHCPAPKRKPNDPYYWRIVDLPPRFLNINKKLSKNELQEILQDSINKIVKDNFKITQGYLGLSGRQRIYSQFKIDTLGKIQNIKIRAPHPKFKTETSRVINLFPQFIPAEQNGKIVSTIYNLPIIFKVED